MAEFNFSGKTILVTGAGQGIGRGLCLKLAKSGAKVFAVSRTKSYLDELAKEDSRIHPINVDLADWSETRRALVGIKDIDGLVNNAGVALNNPFFDITEDQIDKTFSINVKAVINVTQMIAKGMVERRKGSVVNVSSVAELIGLADHTVYCGSKGAVGGITRTMALELGKHNVRVNSVNPTVVFTPMGQREWGDPAKADPAKALIPLGRFAEVEEVVDTILFLLSDNSSMLNGITLPIDGGRTAT